MQNIDAGAPMTDEEALLIFELFDADGNGTIDIDELAVFVKAIKQRDTVSREQVSEVWDKDQNGQVTVAACGCVYADGWCVIGGSGGVHCAFASDCEGQICMASSDTSSGCNSSEAGCCSGHSAWSVWCRGGDSGSQDNSEGGQQFVKLALANAGILN